MIVIDTAAITVLFALINLFPSTDSNILAKITIVKTGANMMGILNELGTLGVAAINKIGQSTKSSGLDLFIKR